MNFQLILTNKVCAAVLLLWVIKWKQCLIEYRFAAMGTKGRC